RAEDGRLRRSPLDQSGDRISKPARRLSEAQIRHPEGINRIWYDGLVPFPRRRKAGPKRSGLLSPETSRDGSLRRLAATARHHTSNNRKKSRLRVKSAPLFHL
ncbi:MAG: hypothetical protein ABN488_14895, partial [Methylobacteriaceae bacterium]